MSEHRDTAGRFVVGYSAATGQESLRTSENAQRICEGVIQGRKLWEIAVEIGWRSHASILMWVAQDPEFEAAFRRAKVAWADAMAEEIIDIADNDSQDWIKRVGRRGQEYEVPNKEVVMRSRLRIDARLKMMAAYAPHRYGQKVEVEHDVSDAFAERLVRARARVEALASPVVIDNEDQE